MRAPSSSRSSRCARSRGCGGGERAARDAGGSTLRATWRDPDGDGVLTRGPGEPLRDRTDLARAAAPGRTLATLAVLTDVHVRDEESPGAGAVPRPPRRRRSPRPSARRRRSPPRCSTPPCARSNAARPDAVLVTGDLVDNAQANELALARTVLDGGRARPRLAARAATTGVQAAADPDPAYYRPDVDPPRHPRPARRRRSGPSARPGCARRWYAVPGNHDLLVAGELARDARRPRRSPSASERLVTPDAGLDVPRSENALTPQLVDGALSGGLPGTHRARRARPARRRELTPPEAVAGLRAASGARRQRRAHGLRLRRRPRGAR